MKEFDYEKAKAGHPLCTRDGREVKILTFEARNCYPIFGMVKDTVEDRVTTWNTKGRYCGVAENRDDLMLAPKKVVAWINIYHDIALDLDMPSTFLFPTEEEAREDGEKHDEYVTTAKVEYTIE